MLQDNLVLHSERPTRTRSIKIKMAKISTETIQQPLWQELWAYTSIVVVFSRKSNQVAKILNTYGKSTTAKIWIIKNQNDFDLFKKRQEILKKLSL